MVDPAERATLMKDAEIAWRYFDLLTNEKTGLIPATASLQGGLFTHQQVTMWDVGSTLIGLVAANAIGLIDTPDFMDRVEKALAHIGDATLNAASDYPACWCRPTPEVLAKTATMPATPGGCSSVLRCSSTMPDLGSGSQRLSGDGTSPGP